MEFRRFLRAATKLTIIYAANFIGTILGSYQLVYLKVAFLHYPSDFTIFARTHRYVKPAVGR